MDFQGKSFKISMKSLWNVREAIENVDLKIVKNLKKNSKFEVFPKNFKESSKIL
jgi:hypothetical protein